MVCDSFNVHAATPFLGALAKLQKSYHKLRHVCPSIRMEQLGSHWTDFN
jgi:hypothetical protein